MHGRRDAPVSAARPHARHLARLRPRRPARAALRLPRRRAVGSGARPAASTRTSCCSTHTRARSRATPLTPRVSATLSPPTSAATRHPDTATPRRRPAQCRGRTDDFDWGDDRRPRRLWRRHRHLRGARQGPHRCATPRSPTSCAGPSPDRATTPTIGYLNGLGVTAVELLPVHHFVSEPALAERGLVNYWGYNTVGFFAPHAAYSPTGTRGEQIPEFKEMVRKPARRGARGHPRRRLQPHRRGRPDGADAVLPRARRRAPTTGTTARAATST